MKVLNVPISRFFSLVAISFLIGISLSAIIKIDFNRSWFIFTIIICLYVLILLFNYINKIRPLSLFILFLVFINLGLIYSAYFDSKEKEIIFSDQNVIIVGSISAKPERTYNSQKVLIKEKKGDQVLSASIPAFPTCYYGDQINLTGKTQSIRGTFSERSLKAKKVSGIITNSVDVTCFAQNLSLKDRFIKGLYQISERSEEILGKLLTEPEASFAAGIILGSKRNIPQNFSDALNTTGLTHVIALSGYNVTIIIFVLSEILSNYFNKRSVFLIALLLIIMFVIMTGASSSVIRAAIFSLSLAFGRLIGRRGDLTNLMLLAAVFMVLFNPFILMNDIGFQLSFLAFSGLIYLSPILNIFFQKSFMRKIPEIVSSTLRETLSAQIMVFPIILFYFGRVSIISPLSNILILWLIPLAMLLSFLVGLFGFVFQPLGTLMALLAWPVLALIINTTLLLSKIPLASAETEKQIPAVLLIYPLLLFVMFLLRNKYKNIPLNEKYY